MKYIFTALALIVLFMVGCDKNSTESEDDTNGIMEHSTLNVKTNTEYFNFASNSGSTDANSAHDIVFYSVMWTPPGAPVTINDPRFQLKDGLSIAVLSDKKLDDVTSIPASEDFVTDFISEKGEWYNTNQTGLITSKENSYIVNTTDGKFPAFVIISYYDEQGITGVYNLEWKYLNN